MKHRLKIINCPTCGRPNQPKQPQNKKCVECFKKYRKIWRHQQYLRDKLNTDFQEQRRLKRLNIPRLRYPEEDMFQSAKQRAKLKNLEFSIILEDIKIPKRCPILKIPLFVNTGQPGPNSPSLDRINNKLGYTPENISVISYRANALKRDATFKEIESLYNYMKNKRI